MKKVITYLPIRIFGNFMDPAVVVKNLGDANFKIFVGHVSFKFVISGRLDIA